MEMLADLRQIAHSFHQTDRYVAWVRTRESDPLDTRHLVNRLQQSGEIALRVVRRLVVIHDLAEQLNFAMPLARRLPNFSQDVALRPHPLRSAGIGHHAERAEFVAPFDDG